MSVTFNVISGHRDPGATLCPGQYLYDRLPSIRSGAAPIAAQVLRNYTAVSSVTPADQQVAYGTRAKWSAFLQVSSNSTLTITEACSGQVVRRYTGFYSERGTVKFDWDLRNSAGGLVRGGAYSWSWQTAIGGSASGSIDVMPARETAAAGTRDRDGDQRRIRSDLPGPGLRQPQRREAAARWRTARDRSRSPASAACRRAGSQRWR